MKENIRKYIKRYKEILENIESVQTAIDFCVENNRDEILSLNRDQMLYGRDANGNILTPDYHNDPYFETKEAAEKYAQHKYDIESEHESLIKHKNIYGKKPKDTPNILITGRWFQNEMYILTRSKSFELGSTGIKARQIEEKYNPVLGLSPESKQYFWIKYLRYEILKHLGFKK
ncbi:hypothetical protein IR083_20955 [Dysgonomonas sp. GY75]|uniref:hypothetical protein n=1 Tax=Dysgonomonas sp. GY75 TaxID=2780419 RepID=UPI001884392E|nr:hypothetical protein [Dysgonomonas sp. GY75]MBF0651292.1 hypothetical protein [Dysgonomonas sp. GY75]